METTVTSPVTQVGAGDVAGGDDEPAVQAMRRIEAEVLTLLRRARRTSAENARLLHPELSTSGYAVLLHVVEHEPTRAADVVEQLDMDKGLVSRQVHHLERLGLLTRSVDPEDARAHRLVLSERGRRRVAVLRDHRRQQLESQLTSWSAPDLDDFARHLARYNTSVEPSTGSDPANTHYLDPTTSR